MRYHHQKTFSKLFGHGVEWLAKCVLITTQLFVNHTDISSQFGGTLCTIHLNCLISLARGNTRNALTAVNICLTKVRDLVGGQRQSDFAFVALQAKLMVCNASSRNCFCGVNNLFTCRTLGRHSFLVGSVNVCVCVNECVCVSLNEDEVENE